MNTPQSLEERIAVLEGIAAIDAKFRPQYVSSGHRHYAKTLALQSLLSEIARHLPIDPSTLAERCWDRERYFLARIFEHGQDMNPGDAAAFDDRTEDEMWTEEGFPPLPWV